MRQSRRDFVKKAAALGAATWTAPAIVSVQGSATWAQTYPQPGPDISFIGLNVTNTNGGEKFFAIKYEGCTAENGCFEADPGKFPECDCFFVPNPKSGDGDTLGFTAIGPNAAGCVTINVPDGFTVTESAIKGAQLCCPGPTGTGPISLVFCPPTCVDPCP